LAVGDEAIEARARKLCDAPKLEGAPLSYTSLTPISIGLQLELASNEHKYTGVHDTYSDYGTFYGILARIVDPGS
jgi:hypothetical protein